MKKINSICVLLVALLIGSCNQNTNKQATIETDEKGVAILSDEQVKEMVKRSYQYVAMYNVNQKLALAEEGLSTKGYNKGLHNTDLLDHTAQFIARPNNDVLYQLAMIDLRKDAAVFEFPAFESNYVSLLTSSYDHYVDIPLSTVEGDLEKMKTWQAPKAVKL
jgi:hypothetical protein